MTSSNLPHVSYVSCEYEKDHGTGTPDFHQGNIGTPSKNGGFELLKLFTKKGSKGQCLHAWHIPTEFLLCAIGLGQVDFVLLWQEASPFGVPGGFQTYEAPPAQKKSKKGMQKMREL